MLIKYQPLDWLTLLHTLKISPYWSELSPLLGETVDLEKPLTIPQLWQLLDRVWQEMQIDSSSEQDLKRYYNHPVWLLNGLVTECDPISFAVRSQAARMAYAYNPQKIIDMGGGYGSLLKQVTQIYPEIPTLHIYDLAEDPTYLQSCLAPFPKIQVVAAPQPPYDLIYSLEVFEHLLDPILEVYKMNQLLKIGGGLITTYSFYPMIHCHLPQNFYLSPVFHRIVQHLGFRLYGFERPGTTIWSFQKIKDISFQEFKQVKLLVKLLQPLLEIYRKLRS
jgi:hypothetical protein